MPKVVRRFAEPLVVSLALALSACAGSPASDTAPKPGQSEAPAEASTWGTAANAGLDPNNPPAPIASTTMKNKSGVEYKIDLLQVKRDGDKLVDVVWGITPQSAMPEGENSLFYAINEYKWQPELIDVENLVMYHPIRIDEYGHEPIMSDTVYTKLTANETSYIYATFPAPQSPTVSVHFQPDQTSKFTGVPIS